MTSSNPDKSKGTKKNSVSEISDHLDPASHEARDNHLRHTKQSGFAGPDRKINKKSESRSSQD